MITNYLSPISFTVTVERLPNVEFFTQKATIPGLTMTPTVQASPLKSLYNTPDRLEYGEFELSFIVDESMDNYFEILSWMEGMGPPESSTQFANLQKSKYGLTSDITLLVQNSNRRPNIKFTFKDCFPISLAAISLDVTQQDVFYPECNITFRHNGFKFEKFS